MAEPVVETVDRKATLVALAAFPVEAAAVAVTAL
jgi:hypothetical protein